MAAVTTMTQAGPILARRRKTGDNAMLKKFLIALLAIIAVFLVVVALQPSEFQVERTATMAAPPVTVFDQVNAFHKWES